MEPHHHAVQYHTQREREEGGVKVGGNERISRIIFEKLKRKRTWNQKKKRIAKKFEEKMCKRKKKFKKQKQKKQPPE